MAVILKIINIVKIFKSEILILISKIISLIKFREFFIIVRFVVRVFAVLDNIFFINGIKLLILYLIDFVIKLFIVIFVIFLIDIIVINIIILIIIYYINVVL